MSADEQLYRRVWPPGASHDRCRVANRWYNSSFTEPHHLLPALCFWVTTGWPPESVHDFLAAIRPAVGWEEEWVSHPKLRKNYDHLAWRRYRADYGLAYSELMQGSWVIPA